MSLLIGSLVVTGLELAMRRRKNRNLWNLTIDEFAGYVSQEGSATTFAHVLSEGRKFGFTMSVAHQTLSQVSERIWGAINNVGTKVIFQVGRYDSEYLAKIIGKVNTDAVKRDPKIDTQHEVFSPLAEQWETQIDALRFQQPRYATVATNDNRVVNISTLTVPPYLISDEDVENFRQERLAHFGIPFNQAKKYLDAKASQTPQGVTF